MPLLRTTFSFSFSMCGALCWISVFIAAAPAPEGLSHSQNPFTDKRAHNTHTSKYRLCDDGRRKKQKKPLPDSTVCWFSSSPLSGTTLTQLTRTEYLLRAVRDMIPDQGEADPFSPRTELRTLGTTLTLPNGYFQLFHRIKLFPIFFKTVLTPRPPAEYSVIFFRPMVYILRTFLLEFVASNYISYEL